MEESQQPQLIALCTVMIALSTLAVLLRLWGGRIVRDQWIAWDDIFAIIALVFIWTENALIFWWISLGLGKHAVDVPKQDLAKGPLIIFAAAFLYDAALSFPKFAVLVFYHRVFARTDLWFHRALYVVGSLAAGWLVASWFSTLFQCWPVQKAWDSTVPGHCFPQWNWFLGTAISSTIIDLCILIMPLPMLWRLQTSLRRKLLLMGVFVFGYGVVVVSIGRLVALAQAGSRLEDDLTWGTIPYITWLQCEGPISLISVCLPNIFQLAKRVHDNGFRYIIPGRLPSDVPSYATTEALMKKRQKKKPIQLDSLLRTSDTEALQYQGRSSLGTKTWAMSSATQEVSGVGEADSQFSRDDRIYIRAEVDVERSDGNSTIVRDPMQ